MKMALEKNDFDKIEKIIEKSAENTRADLRKEIASSAEKTKSEIGIIIKEEIEGLAIMTNNGFNGVQKQLNEHNRRFDILESGQEDIKLRLDNVAYRFELIQLQSRVKRLEKKVGISH